MREGHARILLAVKNKTDVIIINELCLIHPGWERQKCDNSLSRHLEKDYTNSKTNHKSLKPHFVIYKKEVSYAINLDHYIVDVYL